MLKGHVFPAQLFKSEIFALFINTFLNGRNGVSNNYKNGMAVSYEDGKIKIDSGVACIGGRFVEEETYTTIPAGVEEAYCKLVIEIDLDKVNTEIEFKQGSYKIIKGTNNYPDLIQNNIVKNNSGIYQYELARFKTSANGISNFEDKRTFIDFDGIYKEIEEHIKNIDAGKLGDSMYPVGSVYANSSDVNPATLFGGTWTKTNSEGPCKIWKRTA